MSELDLLKAYLAKRDVACPASAYNLRRLASEACPECRQPLRLEVVLERPVTNAWLAAVIPFWIVGGGATVAMLIVFVVAGNHTTRDLLRLFRGQSGQHELWMLIVYPTAIAILLAPVAWHLSRAKGRRWFATTPRRTLVRNVCLATSVGAVAIWTAWLFHEVR
jgi:hypothetical protein